MNTIKEIIKQGYARLVDIGAAPYGSEATEFAKIRCLKHLQDWSHNDSSLVQSLSEEIGTLEEMLVVEQHKLFVIDKGKDVIRLKHMRGCEVSFPSASFNTLEQMVATKYDITTWKTLDIGWYEDTVARQIENALCRIDSNHVPFWKQAIADTNKLNIHSKATTPEGRLLSNFSTSPMIIDDINVEVRSFDSFWQALKFNEPDRPKIYGLDGTSARCAANTAPRRTGDVTDFRGRRYIIGLHTDELAEEVLRAKYEQNLPHREALIASFPKELVHYVFVRGQWVKDSESIPRRKFIEILNRIRQEYM